MPDIGKSLKDEIARIARREAKQVAAKPRSDSIELKRAVAQLKRQIAALEKAQKPVVRAYQNTHEEQHAVAPEQAKGKWFSGKGIKRMRDRLGLSKADFARLAGTSDNMVARWEQQDKKLNLRAKTVEKLLGVRTMGRRKALQALSKKPAKSA